MAATSPGSRLEGKLTSDIHCQSLRDKATLTALSTLHTLVRTSFGPSSKLKVLHNNSGGHTTVTSSCSRLLNSLSITKPVVRLLTTAVQGHLSSYSDGGLFTALLSLNLLQNSLRLGVHPRLVSEVHELLLRQCLELLNNPQFECTQDLDLGNLKHLEKLVSSVISPKAVGCGLSSKDVEHITRLVVRAFLKTFQGSAERSQHHSEGVIHYLTLEGRPASDSQLLDGILFAEPQIPTYRNRPLDLCRLPDGTVRVALFTTSLAGDCEQLLDTVYELTADDVDGEPVELQDAVLETLEEMAGTLVAAGVGVVCCQKVVHPNIKEILQAKGLLVIGRLGSTNIGPIQALTGGTLLASFIQVPPEGAYGVLDTVQHVVLGERSYLHLQRQSAPVCTLVTCQRTESSSEELKHVVKVGGEVLQRALTQPTVLAGGGCWQVHLAAHIRTLLVRHETDWCRTLSCSPSQLVDIGRAFCLALDQVAMATSTSVDHMTDSTNHHHWTLSRVPTSAKEWSKLDINCCCGMYNSRNVAISQYYFLGKENTSEFGDRGFHGIDSGVDTHKELFDIVDHYEICVNGLKTAVAAANMVLGIQNYIHDTN